MDASAFTVAALGDRLALWPYLPWLAKHSTQLPALIEDAQDFIAAKDLPSKWAEFKIFGDVLVPIIDDMPGIRSSDVEVPEAEYVQAIASSIIQAGVNWNELIDLLPALIALIQQIAAMFATGK